MRIKIVRQINSRWSDGRVLSAMDGTERTIDDADTDMVAHARHLARQGDVEILHDEPFTGDLDETDDDDSGATPPVDEGVPTAAKKAVPAKKATPAKKEGGEPQ